MKRLLLSLFALALILTLAPVRAEPPADEDKSAQAADDDKPTPSRRARLVKPWADLSTLSDEQKQKIIAIHADYVARINQLRDEEEAAIMALLTDENKAELEANAKAKKQADKERAAARRAERDGGTPSTQPSDKD
jgi:Spy/CpxP family protein refolding chaperone